MLLWCCRRGGQCARYTHTRRALVVQGSGSGGLKDTRLQAQSCTHMPASRISAPTPLEPLQSTPRAVHAVLVLSVGWPVRTSHTKLGTHQTIAAVNAAPVLQLAACTVGPVHPPSFSPPSATGELSRGAGRHPVGSDRACAQRGVK